MTRVLMTLAEAAKVGIVAWGVLVVDPFVAEWFPTWPGPLRYFAAVVVGALLLEIILSFVFGVPRVHVRWFAAGDAKPLDMIDIASTKRLMTSGPFTVKVLIPATGWLGRLALRKLLRDGLKLRIRVPNAPVEPFVEDSDEHNSFPTVTPDNATRGFAIDLGSNLPNSGEWRWGNVSWKLTHLPDDGEFTVDYVWDHPNAINRGLIKLIIRKPKLVKKLRVRRK